VPALTSFVLPGGAIDASSLHLARTICRRAERRVVTLSNQVDVNEEIVKYLNRLSDLLFVLARALNCRAEVAETLWSRNA
jgi:cob(I)alamin adenosyltransferase